MSDFYFGDAINLDNSLSHYGVLGMKWHVHRGRRDLAYEKAGNKIRKISNKLDKFERKTIKAQSKRLSKNTEKAAKQIEKQRELERKLAKSKKKIGKFYKKMYKVLGEEPANKLMDENGSSLAKSYSQTYVKRKRRR